MRKKEDFPYPNEGIRTHYDGCWKDPHHHNCAVAEVDFQMEQVQRLSDSFDAAGDRIRELMKEIIRLTDDFAERG